MTPIKSSEQCEELLELIFRDSRKRSLGDWSTIWLNVGLLGLQLHGAIYRPDAFVLMLYYCANLKAIRYESTSLNRIVADKLNLVIVA